MKKSAAILGIMLLLLLSGCRPNGETGGGTTPPTQQPGIDGPVEETTPPPPVETQPQDTDPPQMSEEPAVYLTADELAQRALQWSETYQNRFGGYSAFHIDHTYWFAEYAGASSQVAFTAADGGDGTVFFLPGDAASDPASAAALMLGQDAQALILVDRERVLGELSQRMAAMEEKKLTEETALSAFLKDVQYVPALMEDMWYCVSTEDVGYILMVHEGAYRLQRMAAMVEYAETPEFQVHLAFDKAVAAYNWFGFQTLPTISEDVKQGEEGTSYYRVDYPGITSMLELRTYLKTLFSDEIVDRLLSIGYYKDFDGVLYAYGPDGGYATFQGPRQATRESGVRLIYSLEGELHYPEPADTPIPVTMNLPYEKVGDKWVFTEFSWPG